MTNQEFQGLIEVNKKLGGKYDAIAEQLAEDLQLEEFSLTLNIINISEELKPLEHGNPITENDWIKLELAYSLLFDQIDILKDKIDTDDILPMIEELDFDGFKIKEYNTWIQKIKPRLVSLKIMTAKEVHWISPKEVKALVSWAKNYQPAYKY